MGVLLTIAMWLLLFLLINISGGHGDPSKAPGGDTTLTIWQTWPQEPSGYGRTALVRIPPSNNGEPFPVVVDLHGIGAQGNLARLGNIFGDTVVLVAPNGY